MIYCLRARFLHIIIGCGAVGNGFFIVLAVDILFGEPSFRGLRVVFYVYLFIYGLFLQDAVPYICAVGIGYGFGARFIYIVPFCFTYSDDLIAFPIYLLPDIAAFRGLRVVFYVYLFIYGLFLQDAVPYICAVGIGYGFGARLGLVIVTYCAFLGELVIFSVNLFSG